MNKALDYSLKISAVIPATYLFLISLWTIVIVVGEFKFESDNLVYLLTSILGMFGYAGLILLLVNKLNYLKSTRLLLGSGVLSLVIFLSISGSEAWKWVLTFEEPGEWLVINWQTIVAFFYIIKITKQLTTTPKAH